MWTKAETWLGKITSLLTNPPKEPDEYPNDRLPSEQVIGDFALRGYRGPPTLVAATRYFSAKQVDGFIQLHARDMAARGWPVDRMYVERDLRTLEQMALSHDAVRVIPAY